MTCSLPHLGPNYSGFLWKEEWKTIFPDISVLWILSYLEIFDIVLIFCLKINFSDYPYIPVISFVQQWICTCEVTAKKSDLSAFLFAFLSL